MNETNTPKTGSTGLTNDIEAPPRARTLYRSSALRVGLGREPIA